MSWESLGEWWESELAGDPAYEEVVTPVLLDLITRRSGLYLDLGSGEGRLLRRMRAVGIEVVGVELNAGLARHSRPVVVARLPGIPFATDSVTGACAVLLLDHLDDLHSFFAETARVVAPGGELVVVSNHPTWTSPGSTPIADSDGETLWRPGDYFSKGATAVPAAEGEIIFHHRTMADLLTTAARHGWSLDEMVERPHHESGVDPGVPRLLGIRWRSLSGS